MSTNMIGFTLLFCQVAIAVVGLTTSAALRRKGYIICRQEVQWDIVTRILSGICYTAMTAVFARAYGGMGGALWFIVWMGIAAIIWGSSWTLYKRRWNLHKDHDEDCVYGPRKHKGSLKNKIKWVHFAPAPKTLQMPA